jgi:hypothetical protein
VCSSLRAKRSNPERTQSTGLDWLATPNPAGFVATLLAMTCCLLLCQSKTDRNNAVLLLIFFIFKEQLNNLLRIWKKQIKKRINAFEDCCDGIVALGDKHFPKYRRKVKESIKKLLSKKPIINNGQTFQSSFF